jgi:IclR family acetate operon transcriptional repressor
MKGVIRAAQILEAVSREQPVTLAQLAKILGLPKSTVQRTLATLLEVGWLRVDRTDTARWEVGPRILAVRAAVGHGTDLLLAAREPMTKLRDELNETVFLSVPDGLQAMVVIDRLDSDHVVRAFYQVGDVSPLLSTASGRAILASLPLDERLEAVRTYAQNHQDEEQPNISSLMRDLSRIQERGYSLTSSRAQAIRSVSAPVPSGRGPALAAVTVSIPESRFRELRLPHLGKRVISTAEEISHRCRE